MLRDSTKTLPFTSKQTNQTKKTSFTFIYPIILCVVAFGYKTSVSLPHHIWLPSTRINDWMKEWFFFLFFLFGSPHSYLLWVDFTIVHCTVHCAPFIEISFGQLKFCTVTCANGSQTRHVKMKMTTIMMMTSLSQTHFSSISYYHNVFAIFLVRSVEDKSRHFST